MIGKQIATNLMVCMVLVLFGDSFCHNLTNNHVHRALNDTRSSANSTNDVLYDVPWYIITILSILYGSISLLAVLGNGLIVWVVFRSKAMHNVTNYFISNLALADIVIGMFAVPFQVIRQNSSLSLKCQSIKIFLIFKFQAALLQYWVLPQVLCKIAPFASTLSVNVSIFTLVAISLDRYHAILYPFKPKLRVKSCYIIITAIWLISLLLSSFHLYINDVVDNRCLPLQPELYEKFLLFLTILQYIIPFVIISFAYFRIGFNIYFDKPPDAANSKQEQNKKKVRKMFLKKVAGIVLD
jgi:leucokinin receptor